MTTKTKHDLRIPYSWEERRPVLLEKFFYVPKQYDYVEDRLDWTELFQNEKSVHMELCSGNGQWIAKKALENPEVNWVAVELLFSRARQIWLKSLPLPNLFVVCSEARTFLNFYSPKVDEIYINFPDPWPKRRHAHKRLLQAPFIQDMQKRVLSQVTIATDDEPYHLQMVEEFEKAGGWKATPFENTDYGNSFFSDLWTSKGLKIHYLRYQNAHSF